MLPKLSIMASFPCECNGPNNEERTVINEALRELMENDPTPLPPFSGRVPRTYQEPNCSCQQAWPWLTQRLLLLISDQTQSIGTERYHESSQAVADNLYIFHGTFLQSER